MSTRGSVGGLLRDLVLSIYGGKCHYCPRPATSIDHIIPWSVSRCSAWWNLAPACFRCNNVKADRMPPACGCWRCVYAARVWHEKKAEAYDNFWAQNMVVLDAESQKRQRIQRSRMTTTVAEAIGVPLSEPSNSWAYRESDLTLEVILARQRRKRQKHCNHVEGAPGECVKCGKVLDPLTGT